MEGSRIKRPVLYVVIVALVAVLVWRIAPLLSKSGPETPAPGAGVALGPNVPPGAVLVNVNMIGYDPDSIEAKAGQPLKLAFFRPANATDCTREVVFPSLGIRRELPPGQTVVVEITPAKSGPLGFECGMSMLKGQLIVR